MCCANISRIFTQYYIYITSLFIDNKPFLSCKLLKTTVKSISKIYLINEIVLVGSMLFSYPFYEGGYIYQEQKHKISISNILSFNTHTTILYSLNNTQTK